MAQSGTFYLGATDQPNVVPRNASVWYFFRELDYPHVMDMWKAGDDMAKGAALMTNTTFTSRLLGAAWPVHTSRPITEALARNIEAAGMPQWTDDDQKFARAVQHELKQEEKGLNTKPGGLKEPEKPEYRMGGGSDDIGDISWNAPTAILWYPANIPGTPGHNWADAMAMATPIAHKGVTAGAKAVALTVLDLLMDATLRQQARDYFDKVQTQDVHYQSFLRPGDTPAVWLNRKIMDQYREAMKKFYYDPSRYATYLEQLGIKYPVLARP